jgi:hypothetical protein
MRWHNAPLSLFTLAIFAACSGDGPTGLLRADASAHDVIQVSTGTVVASVTYLGEPVQSWSTGCGPLSFGLRDAFGGYVSTSSASCAFVNAEVARDVPAGSYTLRVLRSAIGSSDVDVVPSRSITLLGGDTARASFEVGEKLGQVRGRVIVNGQPVGGYGVSLSSDTALTVGVSTTTAVGPTYLGYPVQGSPDSGSYRMLMIPGPATGHVTNSMGVEIATFHVNVVAGQTVNAGSVGSGTGSILATVTYLGEPVQSWSTGCGPLSFGLRDATGGFVSTSSSSCAFVNAEVARDVPAGSYTLRVLRSAIGSSDVDVVPSRPITLLGGATARASFEVGEKVGQVRGRVIVNGRPASGYSVWLASDTASVNSPPATTAIGPTYLGYPVPGSPDSGSYRTLMIPGPATGHVVNTMGTEVATFHVTVVAGQTVNTGNPLNSAPIVTVGGPYAGKEGDSIALSLNATDPDNDVLAYTWDFGDGTRGTGSAPPASHTYADNGTYTITLLADDGKGGHDTKSASVSVVNVAPVAVWSLPASVPEGSAAKIQLVSAQDPSSADMAAGLRYAFDCGTGYGPFGASPVASCVGADDGTLTIRAKVRDKDGGETEFTGTVTVTNVAPTLGDIQAPVTPVTVGSILQVNASFTDPGTKDTHVASVDWGDGSVTSGTVSGAGSSGSVNASHTYLTAGVYTLRMSVTDNNAGVSNQSVLRYAVVVDPSAGFVTGGGWIISPARACQVVALCGSAAGKMKFNIESRYKRGATTPSGDTRFQDQSEAFVFRSTSYDWLVVSRSKAQYMGTGTINGAGSYGFLLTVTDGRENARGADGLRIKVWEKATGAVIYDNVQGAAGDLSTDMQGLGGGSIEIHAS